MKRNSSVCNMATISLMGVRLLLVSCGEIKSLFIFEQKSKVKSQKQARSRSLLFAQSDHTMRPAWNLLNGSNEPSRINISGCVGCILKHLPSLTCTIYMSSGSANLHARKCAETRVPYRRYIARAKDFYRLLVHQHPIRMPLESLIC